jgi:hypothetical protein
MLDEPYVLDIFSINKRIVVTSAVVENGRVVFVVRDEPEDIKDLHLGFQCLFNDHKRGVLLSTELQVTFNHMRYYRSSSIWTCSLPVTDERNSSDSGFPTVTILPPSNGTKKVYGTGTFHLHKHKMGRPQEPQQIVSCGQAIHNINNETLDFVKLYFPYYRRLGVEHFTFYAEETEPGLDRLQSLLQEVAEGYDDISLNLFPVSYRALKLIGSGEWPSDHQKYTINDCLWRERSNRANWTIMQFDLDEFLAGIPNLKSFLSAWPHDGFSAAHFFPQENLPSTNGGKVNVSSTAMPDWGKSIFRTEKVNVAWNHAVTNPELDSPTQEGARLLHFRRDQSNYRKIFAEKNMTWVAVDY